MESKLESKLQRSVIKLLEKQGWYVLKVVTSNKPGHPDITACKNKITIFVECKRRGKKLEPLQEHRHDELKKRGFLCITIDELKTLKWALALRNL